MNGPRSWKAQVLPIAGAGVAALLLLGGWSNLEAWTIGPLVFRPRPWLYVAFLAVFLTLMRRVFSTVATAAPVKPARGPEAWWPYAVLGLTGALLWGSALVPPQHLVLNFLGDNFFQTPALEIHNVFRPSWLRALASVELGQYRPLKFLLLWVAYQWHGTTVALIGGHVAVGALIVAILGRWGVSRWVATMAGLGFVMHPLTLWYLGTITIQYVWGTLAFFGALHALQRWMNRPGHTRLALVLGSYALSTMFVESWLGGAGILIALLIAHRTVSLRTPSARTTPSIGPAIVLILAMAAALTSIHLLALPDDRLGMAANPRVRRLLLNLWFEPYWAFLMPFESKTTVIQLMAAASLALVPAMALMRNTRLGWQAPVLWVTAGMSLGPALMFFEMTPRWSTGRLAYGPCAVLALCLGLIVAQTTSRRAAAIWSTLCCASLIVMSVVQHVSSTAPADLGGSNRPADRLLADRDRS